MVGGRSGALLATISWPVKYLTGLRVGQLDRQLERVRSTQCPGTIELRTYHTCRNIFFQLAFVVEYVALEDSPAVLRLTLPAFPPGINSSTALVPYVDLRTKNFHHYH